MRSITVSLRSTIWTVVLRTPWSLDPKDLAPEPGDFPVNVEGYHNPNAIPHIR